MDLKYVENISDNNEATVRLFGRIGDTINGTAFADEMRYLSNICSKITMRINSEGGSVLEGYTIIDAMNEIKEEGHCVIATRNVGMAASMASVILCSGSKGYRSADNYSVTMIHNASGETKDTVLNSINASINTIYQNNTAMNGDVASNLMKNETFMDCKMALDMGLIDNVVETGTKLKLPKKKSIENLSEIYNQLLLTPTKMNKITALLGLKNEASEEVVVDSIEALKKDLDTEKAEKEILAARVKELEAHAEEAKVAEEAKELAVITTVVENAIAKGLIKEDKKSDLISLGKINMSLLDTVIEASTKSSVATMVMPVSATNLAKEDDRANWTIVDWMKKDSKGLTSLKNETPEIYTLMYDNYYKLGIGNKSFKNK